MFIDRRVLLGFMALMFVTNVVMFFHPWKQIMAGRNDFPIFYSNASMVREGHASGLYDFEAENQFVGRVSDITRPPNNHLPYELLLFVPLTRLPFAKAYVLWTILGFGMLAGVAFLLRDLRGGGPHFLTVFLTILGFFPAWYCLLQGQDSILLLFLFAVSFWLWRRGNDDAAGLVLALGLFRPQLVLPFALIAFLAGKWKFLRGFIPGAALALILSASVVGLHGMGEYARILLSQGTQQSGGVLQKQWEVRPELMATWRGFLWVCLPSWVPPAVRNLLLLAGTFAGLGWAAQKMRGARSPAAFDLAFAIAVAAVMLVSFHSFLHDFSLMILPLLIYGPVLAASGSMSKKNAYLIVTLGFLLFLTPLYYVLTRTGSVGWLFLVGATALWLGSRLGTVSEIAAMGKQPIEQAIMADAT